MEELSYFAHYNKLRTYVNYVHKANKRLCQMFMKKHIWFVSLSRKCYKQVYCWLTISSPTLFGMGYS